MPRYYFDFHDTNGVLRDEAGDEMNRPGIAGGYFV